MICPTWLKRTLTASAEPAGRGLAARPFPSVAKSSATTYARSNGCWAGSFPCCTIRSRPRCRRSRTHGSPADRTRSRFRHEMTSRHMPRTNRPPRSSRRMSSGAAVENAVRRGGHDLGSNAGAGRRNAGVGPSGIAARTRIPNQILLNPLPGVLVPLRM